MPLQVPSLRVAVASMVGEEATIIEADNAWPLRTASGGFAMRNLSDLPNEVLLQILGYLDVCDLLSTSRVSPYLLLSCFCPSSGFGSIVSVVSTPV
jgi:hypothetical protein